MNTTSTLIVLLIWLAELLFMATVLLIRNTRRATGHTQALTHIATTWPRDDAGHFAEMVLTGNHAGISRHYPEFFEQRRAGTEENEHG